MGYQWLGHNGHYICNMIKAEHLCTKYFSLLVGFSSIDNNIPKACGGDISDLDDIQASWYLLFWVAPGDILVHLSTNVRFHQHLAGFRTLTGRTAQQHSSPAYCILVASCEKSTHPSVRQMRTFQGSQRSLEVKKSSIALTANPHKYMYSRVEWLGQFVEVPITEP